MEIISDKDKIILDQFISKYGLNESIKYINSLSINESEIKHNRLINSVEDHLNEYMIGTQSAKSSSLQTAGKTDPIKKAMIKSIPGFVTALILSWPGTLLAALGAIEHRSEQRWLKTMFNPNYWLDFISGRNPDKTDNKEKVKKRTIDASTNNSYLYNKSEYDSLSKEEKEKLTKEAIKEKAKMYYAELSNKEVIRVKALDQYAAKDQIKKIIEFTPYNKLMQRHEYGMNSYKIVFDTFEQTLWTADNKEIAKTEVKALKVQIENIYRELGLVSNKFPQILQIIDLGKIAIEKPSEYFEVSTEIPLSVSNAYIRNNQSKTIENFYFNSLYNTKVIKILIGKEIYNFPFILQNDIKIIEKYIKEIKSDKLYKKALNRYNKDGECYKVEMNDGDIYYIWGNSEKDIKIEIKNILNIKKLIIKLTKNDDLIKFIENIKNPNILFIKKVLTKEGEIPNPDSLINPDQFKTELLRYAG